MPKVTKRYVMPHKRRLRKQTDYRTRLALVKSGLPRAVVRKSLENITVQIIKYEEAGDKVVAAANSAQLDAYGWKCGRGNLPAAYLTGLLAGMRAKAKGAADAVADFGLQESTKGSRLYAAIKGLTDAGIRIPHDAKMAPDMKRISGQHIADWAAKGGKGFSKYGVRPAELPKHFEEVRARITGSKV
jgi:large subunit ribosomal protein L18